MAARGGDDNLVSIAALGALVARAGWVTPESVRAALREMASKKRPEIVQADPEVFAAGLEAGQIEAAALSRAAGQRWVLSGGRSQTAHGRRL